MAVLLAALALAARMGLLPEPRGGDYERYDERVARVVRVVDGDTLDVNIPDHKKSKTRIRLWGVDAPEVGHHGTEPMYYGEQSSAFVRDTVLDRQVRIELSPVRTRGKYGRLLAYVYDADTGRMLNESLLTTGHAYADTRFDHLRKNEFTRLERRARKERLGLWKQVRTEDLPAWKRRADRDR